MDSNNHNSSCNFSDLLVSYLYGEIGEREKLRFESHVSSCGGCADEIAAFGGVRSSVQRWRETEFAKLSMPVIELPSLEPEKATILSTEETAAVAAAAGSRSSWLAGLRELFSLSPAWTGAATACAALLICAGLFYIAVISFLPTGSERNTAGTNRNAPVAVIPSPTSDDGSANNVPQAGTDDRQPDESAKPEIRRVKKQNPPKFVTPSPAMEKAVVIADNAPDAKAVKPNVAPKAANKEKTQTQAKNPVKQTDIEFTTTREEEDKSLRLSDLFDEVSMK